MLLIESNLDRREQLSNALRTAGMVVRAVGSTAEFERWPAGEIVITERAHYTRWWYRVGATHVVVLTDSVEEGAAVIADGATTWALRMSDPRQLVALLRGLGPASAETPDAAQALGSGSAAHPDVPVSPRPPRRH